MSKKEPPPRPEIRKRQDPAPPTAAGRATLPSTIEVEVGWLEEGAPPAPRGPRGKGPPPIPREEKNSEAPPKRRSKLPPRAEPQEVLPTLIHPVEPPALTRTPAEVPRPRGKVRPPIPREEKNTEAPPRRSKPPAR